VGKLTDDLVGLLAPHHPKLGPIPFELPESLVRAFDDGNPWRAEGAHWWEQSKQEALEETGVDISSVLPRRKASIIALPDDIVTERLTADEDERVRARLSALADRSVRGQSTLPWLLAQVAHAPLLARTTGSEACHVIGYLGRGRMAEIRLFSFDGEEPCALERVTVETISHSLPRGERIAWYDGGDALLRVRTSLSGTLGPRLP
jgi:hypothetical protein